MVLLPTSPSRLPVTMTRKDTFSFAVPSIANISGATTTITRIITLVNPDLVSNTHLVNLGTMTPPRPTMKLGVDARPQSPSLASHVDHSKNLRETCTRCLSSHKFASQLLNHSLLYTTLQWPPSPKTRKTINPKNLPRDWHSLAKYTTLGEAKDRDLKLLFPLSG
jgi:hypothetical protein